jgi:hypothetical protein
VFDQSGLRSSRCPERGEDQEGLLEVRACTGLMVLLLFLRDCAERLLIVIIRNPRCRLRL